MGKSMNSDKARKVVSDLLSLGTLKGVKITMSSQTAPIYAEKQLAGPIRFVYLEYPDQWRYAFDYENILSIEPIPMEPKLLEVGTRVKIIGGEYEGLFGEIKYVHTPENYYNIHIPESAYSFSLIAINNVIPESLLVEEEESENVIIEHDEIYLNISVKDLQQQLEQAGYQVSKKDVSK
jgi:hypothetical protein